MLRFDPNLFLPGALETPIGPLRPDPYRSSLYVFGVPGRLFAGNHSDLRTGSLQINVCGLSGVVSFPDPALEPDG